jgi:uncharacterized membrane protein
VFFSEFSGLLSRKILQNFMKMLPKKFLDDVCFFGDKMLAQLPNRQKHVGATCAQ